MTYCYVIFDDVKKVVYKYFSSCTLHTQAESAVRAAVKTELSYRNDKIITFFFVVNKNKEHVEVALASSKS